MGPNALGIDSAYGTCKFCTGTVIHPLQEAVDKCCNKIIAASCGINRFNIIGIHEETLFCILKETAFTTHFQQHILYPFCEEIICNLVRIFFTCYVDSFIEAGHQVIRIGIRFIHCMGSDPLQVKIHVCDGKSPC